MIPFNRPSFAGNEIKYIRQAVAMEQLSGDGMFTRKCHQWLERYIGTKKALLTTSGTHALEMAALLIDIKQGDEVIMPSYTFSSTANAFVLRGARIKFVDIRPDTLNIDEKKIEIAITKKTRAIVPVHYAGVACEMDAIMKLAKDRKIYVIEDAAQGIMAAYKGKPLGSIGDIGCFSFHETKNLICGEGGAIALNNARFIERAEIIREKGTDRTKFFRREVDKYTWVDIGSSYLPSELNAAFLYAQFEQAKKINTWRCSIWRVYNEGLRDLSNKGRLELPAAPSGCTGNSHLFFIKVRDEAERTDLIAFLKKKHITAASHYVPLHMSRAGKRWGVFIGKDEWTTKESGRILRLPLYYKMKTGDARAVVEAIRNYYQK